MLMIGTPGQTRRIGPLLATVLVAGNMIGSGIFLLPASLARIGSSTVIGWIVSLGGALLIAGMFAVLGATRASPDGLVRWPSERVHPIAGFTSWAAYWTANWTGNVGIVLAAVGYLSLLFPALKTPATALLMTLALIWGLTGLCLFGARVVARFSGLTLIIGLLPIFAAIVLGLGAFSPETFSASWNVTGKPLLDTVPPSLLIIFWAFLGLESAAVAAAVVDNPQRNVPIAALGGVGLAGVIYIAASVAVMGVIPATELQASTAPFAEVVARIAGANAGVLIAVCAIVKICGTVAGWFLVNAECGRSGAAAGYLPAFISESDPNQLPRRGLIVLAILMSAVAVATMSSTINAQFNILLNVVVVWVLAVYALCALALLLDRQQPGRYRLLALAAMLFSLWVVYASPLSDTGPALVFLALCVPVGWMVQRRRHPLATAS
jgi:arginine:agmatine antiporter